MPSKGIINKCINKVNAFLIFIFKNETCFIRRIVSVFRKIRIIRFILIFIGLNFILVIHLLSSTFYYIYIGVLVLCITHPCFLLYFSNRYITQIRSGNQTYLQIVNTVTY